MNIVERAKNICLAPTKEWEVIEGESTPAANLVGSYVAPLVAIGAIAGFIGGLLSAGRYRSLAPTESESFLE